VAQRQARCLLVVNSIGNARLADQLVTGGYNLSTAKYAILKDGQITGLRASC
jgi:hypothetical protein